MDFRVSEAQRELAEGIRAMLAGRLPLERIRAREGEERVIDADDWAALGDTGVFSLTLPEPAGVTTVFDYPMYFALRDVLAGKAPAESDSRKIQLASLCFERFPLRPV